MPTTPHDLVENTIPVLAVADVPAAIRFYCERLQFQLDWVGTGEPPQIASVSRDGHAIMLQRREPATASCVWIGLSELTPLWEQLRSCGDVTVAQRPTNQPWALEMKIKDADGNVLWFGTEPLKGVPFGQEATESELRRA